MYTMQFSLFHYLVLLVESALHLIELDTLFTRRRRVRLNCSWL